MSTFKDESGSEAIDNGDFAHVEDEFMSDEDDELVTESMDDGEYVDRYRLGGLHPVHIGDRLDGTRYKVIQKLGQGSSSTVWLALDLIDLYRPKYVAVKIKESDLSNLPNELKILEHLSKAKSDHPGRIYSSASLLLGNFWIDGPNGRHLALVLQVSGPSISRIKDWKNRLHPCLARSMALQVTQGLEYLHSEGICKGDFTSSDVLFQLANFDSWPEDKLQAQLGKPKMFDIQRGPGRPRYLVDSACFFDAEPQLLTKNITIVGHSQSFFVEFPPSHELRITYDFTAPEVLFGWDVSFYSDIWALGCVIYEMRRGYHMFYESILNPPFVTVEQIAEILGSVPSSWNHLRFNEKGYVDQDGCRSPSFYPAMPPYPLHKQVDLIEDKQISPPNVNGLKESNAGTRNICLIECPFTQWLARAPMKEDIAPLQISVEESLRLIDLLRKIFTYQPEDRISLGEITTHPWLTAPVESTQNTTKTTLI